ncbi:MAG: site-specific tyrosine recombinase XerC [Myxococcota bacterium]|nr:site-specific tyrosine recombinase XerC [Myxococcota bacterium]
MARPQKHSHIPVKGDHRDPRSMGALAERFLEWLEVRNYSEQTVRNRRVYLGYFIEWCEARAIFRPNQVTRPILERYQRYLYFYRKKNGKPLTFRSQHSQLVPVRGFFRWLTRNNFILYNPASDLDLPRLERRLPKHVLTKREVEQILSQADVETLLGIRDRAILETLYSTGMRRMELVTLNVYDLDEERGTLMVRQGKNKKDRMIPIGDRAIAWLRKYLSEVRPQLCTPADDSALFLTRIGEPFSRQGLSRLVRAYVTQADIGKTGSCHLFRHTMATLMLENGADVRFIQQMLGHADLSTTQIYTQVSIRQLKQIHEATHPARLKRENKNGGRLDED